MLEKSMAGTICDLVEHIVHVEKIKFNNISPHVLVFRHMQIFYMKREGGQWVRIGCEQKRSINVGQAAMATVIRGLVLNFMSKTLPFTFFFISLLRRNTLHSVQFG